MFGFRKFSFAGHLRFVLPEKAASMYNLNHSGSPRILLAFSTTGRNGVTFTRTGSKGVPPILVNPLTVGWRLSSGLPSRTRWIGVISGMIHRMTSRNSLPNFEKVSHSLLFCIRIQRQSTHPEHHHGTKLCRIFQLGSQH